MGRTLDSTLINKPVMKRIINTRESNVMNVKDMVTLEHNVLIFLRIKRIA